MDTMLTQSQLRTLILGRQASFAVGVRGVIAEFHWADGDSPEHDDGALEIATPLGAVAFRLGGTEGLTEVTTDDDGHGHAHAARVCWLPEADATLPASDGLTDLGPDACAVRPADRDARLFDMGLGLGHVRACVRTADDALIGLMREHLGTNVLEGGHPVMAAIKRESPHRVFESASARIEVYQPIPSRSRGERTPDGPHTHVLPRLVGSADDTLGQLPRGARPVLTIYPAH